MQVIVHYVKICIPSIHCTSNFVLIFYYSISEITKTRQSRRYAENPRDTAVFRGWRPPGTFFRKNKKPRYGIGEFVYQILGLYRCGQKAPYRQTTQQQSHIFTSENRNILETAARLTRILTI